MGANKLVYHGSDTKFSKFETKFIGSAHGIDAGFGFYFTESKAEALTYGKYIYTCFLNLKRDVSLYQKTFDDAIILKLIKLIEDSDDSFTVLDDFESIFEAATYFAMYKNDVDIIKDLIIRCNDVAIVLKALLQCGYDFTTDRTSPDDETITHYIVYDVNAISINNIECPIGDIGSDAPKAQQSPLLQNTRLFQSYTPKQRTSQASQSLGNFSSLGNFYQCSSPTEFYEELDKLIDYSDIDNNDMMDDDGKAKSKSQRRLFYMALAYKRGELDKKYASDKIKKLSELSDETLHDYAATKQKKRKKDGSVGKRNAIPEKVKKTKK